ncbi:hypothetical protein J6590_027905 [Homalodisca vitripennis]|nr:hypothetical protein J6590_027905 [Homalodisca vitripennis]
MRKVSSSVGSISSNQKTVLRPINQSGILQQSIHSRCPNNRLRRLGGSIKPSLLLRAGVKTVAAAGLILLRYELSDGQLTHLSCQWLYPRRTGDTVVDRYTNTIHASS